MIPFELLFPWLFKLSNTFKSNVGLLSATKRTLYPTDPALSGAASRAGSTASSGTTERQNPAFEMLTPVPPQGAPRRGSSVASKLQQHLDASGTLRRNSGPDGTKPRRNSRSGEIDTAVGGDVGGGHPLPSLRPLSLDVGSIEEHHVHTPTSPHGAVPSPVSPALARGGLASRVAFQRASSPRGSPQLRAPNTQGAQTPSDAASSRVLPSASLVPLGTVAPLVKGESGLMQDDGTMVLGGRRRRRSSIERLLMEGDAAGRSPSPTTRRAFQGAQGPTTPTVEDRVFAEDTRTPAPKVPLGLGLLSTVTPDGKSIQGGGEMVQSPLVDVLWTPSHSRPAQARASSVPPRGALRRSSLRGESLRAAVELSGADPVPTLTPAPQSWLDTSQGSWMTTSALGMVLGLMQLLLGVFMTALAVYSAANAPSQHATVAFLAVGGPSVAALAAAAFLLARKSFAKLGLVVALASLCVEVTCVVVMVGPTLGSEISMFFGVVVVHVRPAPHDYWLRAVPFPPPCSHLAGLCGLRRHGGGSSGHCCCPRHPYNRVWRRSRTPKVDPMACSPRAHVPCAGGSGNQHPTHAARIVRAPGYECHPSGFRGVQVRKVLAGLLSQC
jgi:hypothetical protein